MAEEKKSLVIEKYDYGFRIIIENEPETYFIKDNGDWYTMAIEKERKAVDFVNDRYENLGTIRFNDLLCKLIIMPEDILEMLLGERPKIGKVTIEFD